MFTTAMPESNDSVSVDMEKIYLGGKVSPTLISFTFSSFSFLFFAFKFQFFSGDGSSSSISQLGCIIYILCWFMGCIIYAAFSVSGFFCC